MSPDFRRILTAAEGCMTPTSVRNQTLGFVFVFVGLVAYHAWTTPPSLTLQAVPIAAGEQCYRCQRTITDRSIAAEGLAVEEGIVRKFKTIACMLKYLRDSGEGLDILVTDATSKRLTQARWATFVRTTVDEPSGAVDYIAFRQPPDARRFAAQHGSIPLDWAAVQASERQQPLIR
jgi:hypothetical protein